MAEKHNIKCKKCGYTWTTRSTHIFVSCPSCMQKVKTNENDTQNV